MAQDDLIDFYRQTHKNMVYGNTAVKYIRYLRPHIQMLRPASLLDFGCGQSLFLENLNLDFPVRMLRYDPAIAQYATLPEGKVDLLVNIDVLEHIEEADLDDVLSTMRAACDNALIAVDTVPAAISLPDGRNAHVTLKPHAWWATKIGAHFPTLVPIRVPRRGRAAFMTWRYTPSEKARFRLLRAREDAIYYAKRLVGRHKLAVGHSSVHTHSRPPETRE